MVRKPFESRRQFIFGGHFHSIHQNRNHRNAPLQRRFDLDAQMVAGVHQPLLARRRRRIPILAYYRYKHGTAAHLFSKMLAKIEAKRNRIHILENRLFAELRIKPVTNSAGNMLAILAPIRDEYWLECWIRRRRNLRNGRLGGGLHEDGARRRRNGRLYRDVGGCCRHRRGRWRCDRDRRLGLRPGSKPQDDRAGAGP